MPSSPPPDAEIDTVIAELASKANAAACQGGQSSDYIAIIACIEWARGRELTVDWIPWWVSFVDTQEKKDA